jgi:hypothetical protein
MNRIDLTPEDQAIWKRIIRSEAGEAYFYITDQAQYWGIYSRKVDGRTWASWVTQHIRVWSEHGEHLVEWAVY